MASLKFENRKQLEKWLDKQPREVAVAIAARAALRVLPLVVEAAPKRGDAKRTAAFLQLTASVVRATAVARVAAKYPAGAYMLRQAASTAASATYAARAADASASADVARAADAAASAAADGARAAADGARAAYYGARASASAGIDAYAARAAAWAATTADAQFIEDGGAVAVLADRVLWPQNLPEWVQDALFRLRTALPGDQNWDVWTEWYERRSQGDPRGDDYELVFVSVPLEKWWGEGGWISANAWIREELDKLRKNEPPPLPSQGPGPHVEIESESGRVVGARPASIDNAGNNVSRLGALHPQVVRLATDLASQVSANEQPELSGAVSRYLANVDRLLSDIDFDRLWGEGIFLEEAAAAAERKIAGQLREPLCDQALTTLNSLLRVHGPFIMSSVAGAENQALANAYELRPDEERDRRAAASELGQSLSDYPDVVAPEVAREFKETVDQPESSRHPERSAAFRAGFARNIVVTVAAGAAIGAVIGGTGVGIGMVAGAASGTVAGAAAGAAMLPVVEGLKKSASFLAVSGLVTKSVDALSETDFRELTKKIRRIPFGRYREFMLANADRLRRLMGARNEGKWLNEYLDWLTDHETLPKE